MASTSNITILSNPNGLLEVIEYSKASNEVIAVGDLLEENGSGAEVVDGAANNVFVGIALEARAATDDRPLSVMIRGVIDAKVYASSTAAGSLGKAFKYQAGANGTDWQFTSATAEGVIWALETISKGSYGKFLVDVVALESGKFETVTT